jgi:hypothetical protein
MAVDVSTTSSSDTSVTTTGDSATSGTSDATGGTSDATGGTSDATGGTSDATGGTSDATGGSSDGTGIASDGMAASSGASAMDVDCTGITVADLPSPDFCVYNSSEVFTMNGQCCAILSGTQNCCDGRPFFVGHEARTAPPLARDDWSLAQSPAVDHLGADEREALALAWIADAAMEHASVASFARFVLQLLAIGAPAELVDDAQQALRDEVAHARICFGLASAYRGTAIGPGRLATEGALEGMTDLVAIAVATVREGCVGETIAALHADVAASRASDPVVRAALEQIAEDEARHAALAWRFVAWAIDTGGEPVRAAVAEALRGDPPPPRDVPPPMARAAWRAHGRLSAIEQASLTGRACRDIVAPLGRMLCQPRSDGIGRLVAG